MYLHNRKNTLKGLFSLTITLMGLYACQSSPTNQSALLETGVSRELADFRQSNLTDIRYQLSFRIPEQREESLKAQADITCKTIDSQAFILDFKVPAEQIDSVCLNGKRTPFKFENEHILIERLGKNDENTVSVYYTCSDQSLNRRNDFLYTLLVPDRARTLFPCFDQPNLKALYKLNLEIPSHWKAVANGETASTSINEENHTTSIQFKETEPISTYLFSFVAGKLNEETFHRGNRSIHIYHRENDPQKTQQCTDIATEVFDALEWMEDYTQIPYPFAKYDLIIVPGFQFGGMEHIGATLYTDNRMFLSSQPTLSDQLIRSSLIAHETAHMWFGDYVTMKWFDDVWTKEVFANYFASLVTEPRYPEVNHQLNFMIDYIPGAYNEDRTKGSNPIKQDLDNLEHAGLVYGNIVYNKSPWVISALSDRMGKDTFQKGLQEYLRTYANANATWDDLIDILDNLTPEDLKAWSHSWVNEKGRPTVQAKIEGKKLVVCQSDPWERGVIWPQKLAYIVKTNEKEENVTVNFVDQQTKVEVPLSLTEEELKGASILPNVNGKGYGLFLVEEDQQPAQWESILEHNRNEADAEIVRGALLINLYENLRHGTIQAESFQDHLINYIREEKNPLLYSLALGYLNNCHRWYATDSHKVEDELWNLVTTHENSNFRLQAFRTWSQLAESPKAIAKIYSIWKGRLMPGDCRLSEKDFMKLAYVLALRLPEQAEEIIEEQKSRITQPDRKREFDFVSEAVSPSADKRDSVFAKLLKKENRNVEPWASEALSLLNHPIYGKEAVKYIRPALEEMREIQRTGDIFFPRAWASALLKGHTSKEAAEEVRKFFSDHPDYPTMLGNKIKQQAEHLEMK